MYDFLDEKCVNDIRMSLHDLIMVHYNCHIVKIRLVIVLSKATRQRNWNSTRTCHVKMNELRIIYDLYLNKYILIRVQTKHHMSDLFDRK